MTWRVCNSSGHTEGDGKYGRKRTSNLLMGLIVIILTDSTRPTQLLSGDKLEFPWLYKCSLKIPNHPKIWVFPRTNRISYIILTYSWEGVITLNNPKRKAFLLKFAISALLCVRKRVRWRWRVLRRYGYQRSGNYLVGKGKLKRRI